MLRLVRRRTSTLRAGLSLGGQPALQVFAERDLLRWPVFAVVVALDEVGQQALGFLAGGAGGVPAVPSLAGRRVDAFVDDGVVAVALLGDVASHPVSPCCWCFSFRLMPPRPSGGWFRVEVGGPLQVGEVFVAGVFGDESSDADLAEMVDPSAEFLDGAIERVGVFVEECKEQLFAAFPVAPLLRCGGDAGDLLDGGFGCGGVGDAELAEPFVDRFELSGSSEQPGVQLIDGTGRGSHEPVVAGWGEEEPEDGEIEDHGEDQQFVGVELSAPLAVPGPFDGGDAGLGEPLAEVGLEPVGELFLGPSA